MTMILAHMDDSAKKLKTKGIRVLIEPALPADIAKISSDVASAARKNQTMWNVWDVSGTNVFRLFNH